MYLRYTVPTEHGGTVTRARLAPGPFGIVGRLARGAEYSDDPVRIALERELDWFNDQLPVPKRFDVKARGRWWSDGICWFRDDAREMLSHMEALVRLSLHPVMRQGFERLKIDITHPLLEKCIENGIF